MAVVRFKDVRLHYTDRGKGSVVVLIHGFLESSWMWKDIQPVLSRTHRVITIDLPGHGNSECIGYVHTMDEMAEAVYFILKHQKLRRVSLIGHSMGGYVALAFAEHYPDSVKSLTLFQSTTRADSPQKRLDRDRVIALVKQDHKRFIRQSLPMLFRPVNRKRFRAEINALKSEALKTPPQGIIAALAGMRDRPDREILLKFPPYPVHIIAGDKDPRLPYGELQEQAEVSDSVVLHTLKGSGHMGYIEDLPNTLAIIKRCI